MRSPQHQQPDVPGGSRKSQPTDVSAMPKCLTGPTRDALTPISRAVTIHMILDSSVDVSFASVGDTERRATETLGRVGTALADPTRRRILLILLDGPAYPAALAERLGVARTNVSNHLTCLRGCGLVQTTREGRQIRYELASPRLAHAIADLVDLELDVDPGHEDLDGRT